MWLNKKTYDYWTPMKTKVMQDIEGFKTRLINYDKENMSADIFENKIKPYVNDKRAFTAEAVASVSLALVGLVQWVLAMETYYRVYKVVKPKMIKLKAAEESYAAASASLEEKMAKLRAITEQLETLKQQLADAIAEKRRLENEKRETETKLNRATRLLGGLSSEKDRYRESAEGFGKKLITVNGDALVSAAIVVLLGALPQSVRVGLRDKWIDTISKSILPCTTPFDLEVVLGDPATTLQWRICGLPSDAFSTDNALIYFNTKRVPMLIDPHDQAGQWLKKMEATKEDKKESGFRAVRATDDTLERQLVEAVKHGDHILVEGCTETLDALVNPIVHKQYTTFQGQKVVSVGEGQFALHPNFRITLSTRIGAPTFMTDTSSAVCLVGFFVTKDGLQEQLLQKVLQNEEREQDAKRTAHIESSARSKKQLRDIEDNILTMISTRNDLLETDEVINQLENGKRTAHQLEQRLHEIEGFQRAFEKIRLRYVPFAAGGAQIYTSVASLSFVEPVYQFSLMWYLRLFQISMEVPKTGDEDEDENARYRAGGGGGGDNASAFNALDGPQLHDLLRSEHAASFPPMAIMRVNECFDKLLSLIHRDVTRATFSKDHVVAEMLITSGLTIHTEHQDEEFNYLVRGRPTHAPEIHADKHPSTRPQFVTEQIWTAVCQVTEDLVGPWAKFSSDVAADVGGEFSKFCDQCFKMTSGELPAGSPFPAIPIAYDQELTPFQRLLFVNVLYPPLVVAASKEFLKTIRGTQVLVPAPMDIKAILDENDDPSMVILFILSAGVDPQSAWRAAAADKNIREENMKSVSLGMGMDKRAEKFILEAKQQGGWVLLQNCHLYKDWMPSLDREVQALAILGGDSGGASGGGGGGGGTGASPKSRGLKPTFRLWLTAAPTENVPPSIWFRCIKAALEPPQGLRSGIQRAFLAPSLSDPAFFNACTDKSAALWRRVCFGLCAFDAVLHERKRFGPVGWNIPYGFSEADLSTALNQIQRLILQFGEVPLEAASYLIGECFYGGRVTDVHDRLVLQAILAIFLRSATEEVGAGSAGIALPIENEPVPPPSDTKKSPGWDFLWKHCEATTSDDPNPEACGLHISANLTRLHRDAAMLKESISSALPPPSAAPKKKLTPEQEAAAAEEKKKEEAAAAASSKKKQQQEPSSPLSPTAQQREITPVESMCVDIMKSLHPVFDVDAVQAKLPMSYEDVMNTVLLLELGRYNRLLDKMHKTLKGLVRALRGESVMSAELESIKDDVERGRLPTAWKGSCYPSLRAFASFMTDLSERLQMLDTWIEEGPPIVVWLGGLYFPQPFVTGAMQNFSRDVGVAIDRIQWEFTVVHGTPTEAAQQGCFVGGLYLEAGSWSFDNTRCGLSDPSATELTVPFPVLKLTPVVPPVKKAAAGSGSGGSSSASPGGNKHNNDDDMESGQQRDESDNASAGNNNNNAEDEDEDDEDDVDVVSVPFVAYEHVETASQSGAWKRVARHIAHPTMFYHCPLYRTYERRGVLSTTGHSTNFIFRVAIPIAPSLSEKVITAEYFIRRGTALFTSAE